MEQVGAAAGLAAAACFAWASLYYVRVPIGAGAMTAFKNSLGTILLLLALTFVRWFNETPVFTAAPSAWWDVAWSGIFGLCLADIAYFRSLQILGPRRGLTLTLLGPPATALLGQAWLGETLSWQSWSWIAVTLFGIAIVMWERTSRAPEQEIRAGSTQWGVTCAILGVVIASIGSVILKQGTQNLGTVEATFIRLLASSLFGIGLSGALGQLREIRDVLQNRTDTYHLCLASCVGTVLGAWFMLVSFKYCSTGIAATLTTTTPLFVIPIVWYVNGQRVTMIATFGATVAFAGVCGLLLMQ